MALARGYPERLCLSQLSISWRAFHLRHRLVLAQLLVQYFCLPDSGMNSFPQPGHTSTGVRLAMAWPSWM
jgi:hypothetical protein